jgi:hypothetical protein
VGRRVAYAEPRRHLLLLAHVAGTRLRQLGVERVRLVELPIGFRRRDAVLIAQLPQVFVERDPCDDCRGEAIDLGEECLPISRKSAKTPPRIACSRVTT